MSYKLLLVDDELANVRLLERLFRQDFNCLTASSGAEAIRTLEQHDIAVVITDQRMPEMTGIELLKKTANLRPHMVRILLTGYTDVEALVDAINCGLVYMYITKPWNNDDLKLRISRALEHFEKNRKGHALALANQRLVSRLNEMKNGVVTAFGEAVRMKDELNYQHAARVSAYAEAIGRKMGVSEEAATELSIAAFLHNLGILGTPDEILQRGGQSTSELIGSACAHPECTGQVLKSVAEFDEISLAVRSLGEHFDGAGLPKGLRGEQIPLAARIVRVADEYDLLTQPRDASRSTSHQAALDNLKARAGKEFDPAVVQALAELKPTDLFRKNNFADVAIAEGLENAVGFSSPVLTDGGIARYDNL